MGAPRELTSPASAPGCLVAGRWYASSTVLGAVYARPYDVAPGELQVARAAENAEQHCDPFSGALTFIDPGQAEERSGDDVDSLTAPQRWRARRWWQLDQAVAFAFAQIRDDLVRKTGRMIAIHNQPHDAGRVAGGMPLQLDADEYVGRKQQARAVGAELPDYGDARTISFITVEREGMQRELDAVRHELSAAPIGHDADRSAKLLEARPVQISRVIRWRP